ncbi:MAG TPA: glycosyltransferase family 4 protein [Usitatibacter sp.]|nr:glycosyltransferase family 4 protein [Usitatibacter sp.]
MFSGDREIPVVGGAEVQQGLIAPALAQRGFRVSMITLDYGQPEATVVKGVTVHKFCKPDEGLPVVRFIYPRLTSLWQALARVDADVYYQRTAAALTGFMAHFCRRHGKRSIYAGASDMDFVPGKQDIAYARDRWLFEYGVRNVDRVFVQNTTQLERVRDNFGRESAVVPNCYAPPAGARADRGGYILWVATVRAQKRPEILLEIARRLPQYRFVMVGGHDHDRRGIEYVESVRQAVAALPNVEYRGFLPYVEADRTFDGARVVLNTSSYEGFPNIFLQAWARGIPTVSFVDTRSRAPDGLPVYDIVDDVEAATARTLRLMRDDTAWTVASARVASHFRDHHSLEAAVAVYEKQLLELAGHP